MKEFVLKCWACGWVGRVERLVVQMGKTSSRTWECPRCHCIEFMVITPPPNPYSIESETHQPTGIVQNG